MTMYCVKCKVGKKGKNPKDELVQLSNGKHALTNVCETCGTKMFRLGINN